jgi:hypothetical protein
MREGKETDDIPVGHITFAGSWERDERVERSALGTSTSMDTPYLKELLLLLFLCYTICWTTMRRLSSLKARTSNTHSYSENRAAMLIRYFSDLHTSYDMRELF